VRATRHADSEILELIPEPHLWVQPALFAMVRGSTAVCPESSGIWCSSVRVNCATEDGHYGRGCDKWRMRRNRFAVHAWTERRHKMTLTRRDAIASSLTGLAVLALLATHEGWNVPLIGDSHRWAAAVILALGIGACSTGAKRVNSALFGILGVAAFVFGVLALVTGSLTPLSLLVVDIVVMWALTTFRHAHGPPGQPIAT
jgi:hypothetical protein